MRLRPLAVFTVLLPLMLAACSSPAGTPPPEVVDSWQPPEGTEASPPLSCEEIGSLFAYDASAPLDIREEKRWRHNGVTVIDFNYASPRGGRVPATLVVPDGAGPFAGLVFMHGSGGSRGDLVALAKVYASVGAVGITISAPSNRPEHDNFYLIAFRGEQDSREQIQLIVDLRRAVDILLAQPGVDPQRLAYVGVSYGGAMGGLLAAAEQRLKGYALVVGDGGLVTHFSGAWVMGLPEKVRREWLAAMWPIEPIHYVGCAAPAALLFQNGTLDTQVPPAAALRYQRAGSEPKTVLWYEAGHGLNAQAWLDMARWLEEIVGLTGVRMAFPASVRGVLAVWFLLTVASLALLAVWLWRTGAPRGARLLWLLATVFLGPLGPAAYRVSAPGHCGRGPARVSLDGTTQSRPARPARRAVGSAAWAAGGNTCGIVVVLGLLLGWQQVTGDIPVPVFTVAIALTMLLLPFGAGLLVFAAARRLSRPLGDFSSAYRYPVLTELASTVLVLTAAYPTLNALITRCFGPWTGPFPFDLTYAPLWGGFSLACLAGALLAYPFHWWMIRRGVIGWG